MQFSSQLMLSELLIFIFIRFWLKIVYKLTGNGFFRLLFALLLMFKFRYKLIFCFPYFSTFECYLFIYLFSFNFVGSCLDCAWDFLSHKVPSRLLPHCWSMFDSQHCKHCWLHQMSQRWANNIFFGFLRLHHLLKCHPGDCPLHWGFFLSIYFQWWEVDMDNGNLRFQFVSNKSDSALKDHVEPMIYHTIVCLINQWLILYKTPW